MLIIMNLATTAKTLFSYHIFVKDVIQKVSFCFRIFGFHFVFFFSGKRKREQLVLPYEKQLGKFFVYVR